MQRYHFIKVVALAATATKPARVRVISERYKQSFILSANNEPGDIDWVKATAVRWLEENGFVVAGDGEGPGCTYLVTETFKKFFE